MSTLAARYAVPPTLVLAALLALWPAPAFAVDQDGDGVEAGLDCNDKSAAIKPGATEVCDAANVDEDCDGKADDLDDAAQGRVMYYADADKDGIGGGDGASQCDPSPQRSVKATGDCNDSDAAIKPGATEVCDAADTDEDCDGKADDLDTTAAGKKPFYADKDSDSYGAGTASSRCDANAAFPVSQAGDCRDADAAVHPGAAEVCDAANVDENCDGKADDLDPNASGKTSFFADKDFDKVGAGDPAQRCDAGGGFTATASGDCDDAKANVKPGATEVCDAANLDEDCDGRADDLDDAAQGRVTYFADSDKDGIGGADSAQQCDPSPTRSVKTTGDCNDADAAIKPGAAEVCDGANTDEDCDGKADDLDTAATGKTRYFSDKDSDGFGAGAAATLCDASPTYPLADGTDCNDAVAAIHPGAAEACDAKNTDEDCDGKADDLDTDAAGKTEYYADKDLDKYGTGQASARCDAGAGFTVTANGDCDDAKASVHPGGTETCDTANTDEDCDGRADDLDSEATGRTNWYADADADGAGAGSAMSLCDLSPAYPAKTPGDCNDANAAIKPGAAEVCDAGDTDENCNGKADDADLSAAGKTSWYADKDTDGYGSGPASSRCDANATYPVSDVGDCNDARAEVHPGGTEVCDASNVDENCNGKADNLDGSATGTTAFYADADLDKHGAGAPHQQCDAGNGFPVTSSDDCNDAKASVHPGATEVCDASDTDEDCNGRADDLDGTATGKVTFYTDADHDLFGGQSATQCDPSDGFPIKVGGDCNDNVAKMNPKAIEVCDAGDTDENCNGKADNADPSATGRSQFWTDKDSDGYGSGAPVSLCDETATAKASQAGDCNDANASVNPGESEVCDSGNLDEDCNGKADNADTTAVGRKAWYPDADRDGYGTGVPVSLCKADPGHPADKLGDCNDTNAGINPGVNEVCDPKDLDEDCDGLADDADTSVSEASKTHFYADLDGDGFGGPGKTESSCDRSAGYALKDDDCDDAAPQVHPGATELCDGTENNCVASGQWSASAEAGAISVLTSDGKWADVRASFPSVAAAAPVPWIAPADSTLYVCAGTFYGRVDAANTGTFSVIGRAGAEQSHLAGAGQGSIIDARAGVTKVQITNVTLQGGSADFGGAVRLRGKTALTVEDSAFTGNASTSGGGAIYVTRPATYVLRNVTFASNTSGSAGGGIGAAPEAVGGALVIEGGVFRENTAKTVGGGFDSNLITSVTGTTFERNRAQNGAGLACRSPECTVKDATFNANVATGQGGGAYASGKDTANVKLENPTFTANIAGGGGGLYLSGASVTVIGAKFDANSSGTGGAILIDAGQVEVSATTFTKNVGGGTPAGGNGGAVYVSSGAVTLTACTFDANEARLGAGRGDGGAIYAPGGTVRVQEGTLTNNKAANAGGAIYTGVAVVTLSKTTISNNVAVRGGGLYQTGPGSRMTAVGTTITSNKATSLPPMSAQGGGWYLSAGAEGRLESSSRIDENVASTESLKDPVYGGALALFGSGTRFTCANSSVTANTATGGGGEGQVVLGGGAYLGQGNAVFESTSCEWGSTATDNAPTDLWVDNAKEPYPYAGTPVSFRCAAESRACTN